MRHQYLVKNLAYFCVFIMFSVATLSYGQECIKPGNYLERSIEFVVRWGPGGSSDQFARILCAEAEKIMRGKIAVINKPGASGLTALTYVMSQPADGYTISGINNSFTVGDLLNTTNYTIDDLTYIMRGVYDVGAFFVRTDDTRFKSWKDIVKYAKKRPRTLTCATQGVANFSGTFAEYVFQKAGIQVVSVPYNKPGKRYASFLGGHTDIIQEEPGDMKRFMDQGKVKMVIVFTEERLKDFPDVPTGRELGIDIIMGMWRGIAVKKGTSPEIVRYLECVFEKAWKTKKFQENYLIKKYRHYRSGFMNSKDLTKLVHEEYESFKPVLKKLGYKTD